MKKELIYFLYVFTILAFTIFVSTYYFSDENKKKSYRIINLYDNKINEYNENLSSLESDTEEIIEYVENSDNKNKKKYKFWDLLTDD